MPVPKIDNGDLLDNHADTLTDITPIVLPDNPRFLIVKLWAIGDVLMATPLLNALKRRYPGCHLSWVIDSRYAAILDGNPLVDEVIPLDAKRWLGHFRRAQMPAYVSMTRALVRSLKQREFDCVINLTAEKWWAIWFQEAPVRIGLFPRTNPGYMGRLYTKSIPRLRDPLLHNTDHYILPAAALGIVGPFDRRMSLPNRPEDAEFVRAFLGKQPGYRPESPTLVLHPGTSQESKCWPAEYFAGLIGLLANQYNVAITGSPEESALAGRIADKTPPGVDPPIVAAGKLPDLRQTIALVRQARAVVTGDTSVLHIASAAGTPVVGVYGSTRPTDNTPLFGAHDFVYDETVECSPCGKANCPLSGDRHLMCLRNLTPEFVLRRLEALTAAAAGNDAGEQRSGQSGH